MRDDAARVKLQQKLKNSIIMSGPTLNIVGAAYLTHINRTLYESKGLEFNDVSFPFLCVLLIADKTKVLLYNFFEDSNATLNQWRLVLNGISEGDDLSDAPTFDETRHASICVEVHCMCLNFLSIPLMRFGFIVEIPICRNHSGSEEPLDYGQLRVSWSNEGARGSYNLGNIAHSLRRCTGAVRTGSRSGRLRQKYHASRFRQLLNNGQRLAEC